MSVFKYKCGIKRHCTVTDSTASSMIRCSSGTLSVIRPDNPSLSFRGPYFPEEKLRLCFEVSFWNVASGLTPPPREYLYMASGTNSVFYSGINIDSSLTRPSDYIIGNGLMKEVYIITMIMTNTV